jgi:hypothetical protein
MDGTTVVSILPCNGTILGVKENYNTFVLITSQDSKSLHKGVAKNHKMGKRIPQERYHSHRKVCAVVFTSCMQNIFDEF